MRDRQRYPTRGLTEGAIFAALTAVVAAVGVVVPFVGALLAPLPIMLLVIRWGLRTAILASVVAAVLLLQFFGPVIAALLVVTIVPLGLALGWGVRRGLAAYLTILVGAAASFCATIAAFAVVTAAMHQDLIGQLIESQVRAAQAAASIQQRLGVPPQQIEAIRSMWEPSCAEHHCFEAVAPQFERTTAPVIFALGALISAYLFYTVARALLRRVGHELPGVPPLLAWRLHPVLASTLIGATVGLNLVSLAFPPAAGAALNAWIAYIYVCGFQGALVAVSLMNRWRISRLAQVMAGLLVLRLGDLSIALLAMLGVLDSWFDYRRLAGPAGGTPPSAAPADERHSPAPTRVKMARR